jgi:hypothetical protein
LQRRFCVGKGVVVFLWFLVALSILLMVFGIWLDIPKNRPNHSSAAKPAMKMERPAVALFRRFADWKR